MATIYTPNTGLVSGVQHFYTTTKPTTRPNGSTLAIGDKWWKTDDGTNWFWNGTYWLSSQGFYVGGGRLGSGGSANFQAVSLSIPLIDISNSERFMLVDSTYFVRLGVADANNYVTPGLLQTSLEGNTGRYDLPIVTTTGNTFAKVNSNRLLLTSRDIQQPQTSFNAVLSVTGTPTINRWYIMHILRRVAP